MSGESIRGMLRAQPFTPFDLHLTGGEVHHVTHPESAWIAGSEVYIFYPETERVARCSLLHVTSLEHTQRPTARKKGGKR